MKLIVCLRYLTAADSFQTLSFCFRIAANTVNICVKEVCDALIVRLGPIYLKTPNSIAEWNQIRYKFLLDWGFPNVGGCIDGKHLAIYKPVNSGSDFLNYKSKMRFKLNYKFILISLLDFFSIILMAVVGPNYKFISAEVGMNGRITDGGVWTNSFFNHQINDSENPLDLPNGLLFLADGTFPLKSNLMKPFPGSKLSNDEKLFIFRLSRTRRIVENFFAQLVNTFKVLNNKMQLDLNACKQVSLSCCVLHNFIKTVYDVEEIAEELNENERLIGLINNNRERLEEDSGGKEFELN